MSFVQRRYEVSELDLVYAALDGIELNARVYQPLETGERPFPACVFVHGGAWNFGDRTSSESWNRALAASGLVIVSIDFRDGPEFQHPLASSDVVAAVRWTKLHAAELQADAATVGLMGGSSGGHLATLAAIRPHAAEHQQTPPTDLIAATDVDGTASYVVALYPVSDPMYRFEYATRTGREELVTAHRAYFADDAAMRAASLPRILDDGEAEQMPPLLVVQPGADQNVPLEMTELLLRAYQQRNGHVEYAFFPDQPHGFVAKPPPATDDCRALVEDFIRRHAR
jgi:acetyl esterase/lipase